MAASGTRILDLGVGTGLELPMFPASTRVTGIDIATLTMSEFVDQIVGWVTRREARLAVGVNAHVSNLNAQDPAFADKLKQADLLYADGQSIVWAARALGGSAPERIATTDVARPLAERLAAAGKRMYFFGGVDGVADAAADRLRAAYPGVQIRTHHGYVCAEDTPELLADIRKFRTDLLFVGLGDPLQLDWVIRHRAELGRMSILTCGGLFDWLSGKHRRAPSWMIRGGLEWLWRLFIEPARLAKRYLIGNPQFIARVVRQRIAEHGARRLDALEPAPAPVALTVVEPAGAELPVTAPMPIIATGPIPIIGGYGPSDQD